MSKIRRVLVGHVFVDAGLIWVGDPCYVIGPDASHAPKSWGDFVSETYDAKNIVEEAGRQNVSQPCGDGTGFAISSGYGDGSYPVYVEISDEGTWGERISKIEVDFLVEPKCENCEGDHWIDNCTEWDCEWCCENGHFEADCSEKNAEDFEDDI